LLSATALASSRGADRTGYLLGAVFVLVSGLDA
jgi:hypothetical protein